MSECLINIAGFFSGFFAGFCLGFFFLGYNSWVFLFLSGFWDIGFGFWDVGSGMWVLGSGFFLFFMVHFRTLWLVAREGVSLPRFPWGPCESWFQNLKVHPKKKTQKSKGTQPGSHCLQFHFLI